MASVDLNLKQYVESRNLMLGALVGDIVGSVFEWDNIKTIDYP